MRRLRGMASSATILLGSVLSVHGAPATVTVYSNVCYNSEFGDVLGTRIILLDLGPKDKQILYSEAQGGEGIPIVHLLTPDDEKSLKQGRLDFQLDDGGRSFTVHGTISKTAIVLSSGGSSTNLDAEGRQKWPIRLKRIALPERWPAC